MSRKVLVCGGRGFADRWFLYDWLDFFDKQEKFSEIIEGGATGADTLAREWAKARFLPCTTVKADWAKHGRSAGPLRNQKMIEMQPALVIAFAGGRGTADMLRRAKAAKIVTVELTNSEPPR